MKRTIATAPGEPEKYVNLTKEEVAEIKREENDEISRSYNRNILKEIIILESTLTPRRILEDDKEWLSSLKDQISELRKQLNQQG